MTTVGLRWPELKGTDVGTVDDQALEELDPSRLGAGETRFVDCETGHEVELLIDDGVLGEYRVALANWQERLRSHIRRHLGRYLLVPTNTSLDRLLLRDWRRLGLIS